MRVTFLGTGSAVPTAERNVTSVALTLSRGSVWLFDCGEGTQHRLARSGVKVGALRRIFITHMHGDHVFGLLGLLTSISLGTATRRLDLHGPTELEGFVRDAFASTGTSTGFELAFHVVEAGLVLDDHGVTVRCAPLVHVVPSFGYRVDEPARPGRLDVERARAAGAPEGPVLGRLKAGEDVTLPDGRVLRGASFCEGPLPGRSFAFCTDTASSEGAVSLARDADLLVHEATYAEAESGLAAERLHATPRIAAEVARRAGARLLGLTHFSSRYRDVEPLLAEARAVFPATFAARDLLTVTLGEGPPSWPAGGEWV